MVLVDGKLVEPEAARVSLFDHGFLFGDSVYEVVRTREGRPFLLDAHLARLRRSAAEIYLEIPFTDGELADQVRRVVREAGHEESYIRIIVTRGVGEIELHPATCRRPGLILVALPLRRPPERLYTRGIRLAVVGRRRTHPHSLNPAAKTGNYLNNVLAVIEARRRGADDAVMLNAEGHLAEGTTMNIFFVSGGVVRTPALESGILEGITRGVVVRLVREEGLPLEEGRYPPEALREAEEAFVTSTTRDIMPVYSVDGRVLESRGPGPVTRRLIRRYAAFSTPRSAGR